MMGYKICKNVTPEVRYIHSGIMQPGYDPITNRWDRGDKKEPKK